MIVVDASAAVHALLGDNEPRRLLGQEWLTAPHLIDAEVLHTLRRLAARSVLSERHADALVERWRRLHVQRFAMSGLLDQVWAMRKNVTAYDACYVALAQALDCTLVTADGRLAATPGLACSVTLVPR